MGWTYTARSRGTSNEDWFKRQWGETFAKKVKATATKNGVFYAVIESPDERMVPDAEGKTYCCLVTLVRWVRNAKDGYNFGYKDMDEFMGPYGAGECPERLLKLLSPIKPDADGCAKYAAEWRASCWAEVNKRRGALKLKDGMKVKLPKPVKFINGCVEDTFTVRKVGRKLRFVSGYGNYVLRKSMLADLRLAE